MAIFALFFYMLLCVTGQLFADPATPQTFVSSASSTTDWSGVELDAYQATATNFVGTNGGPYNPGTPTVGSFTGDAGDTLLGFFAFSEGINTWTDGQLNWLADMSVVDGTFQFPAGKKLYLGAHMILGPNGTLAGSNPKILANTSTIMLAGDALAVNTPWDIEGDLCIDGDFHNITMSGTGCFRLGVNDSLTLKNMDIFLPPAAVLYDGTVTSTLQLSNCTLMAPVSNLGPGYYTLCSTVTVEKSIVIDGEVELAGFGQVIMVNGNLIINPNATLHVGPGVTLCGIKNLAFADETSQLWLDGCVFYTGYQTSSRMQLTKGLLKFDDKVKIINAPYGGTVNTALSEGLILGDGADASYDVNVLFSGGAYVICDGCMHVNTIGT